MCFVIEGTPLFRGKGTPTSILWGPTLRMTNPSRSPSALLPFLFWGRVPVLN